MKRYTVKRSAVPVALDAGWDSEIWRGAETAAVDFGFDRNVSGHTPEVRIRMLYDDRRICGLFQVHDRYVIARKTADQQAVCQDSCVEFFVKPATDARYFNFEMNCGGTMLLYHVTKCVPGGYDPVPQADLDTIERYHSLPHLITEEITEPVTWYLGFGIPIAFFEKFSGIDPNLAGQKWTANFTKCADRCSHPTWLSWQELSKCSFHMPDEFGELIFA
ncbi:MAG: carbohydrate-binding family 9-like protein [Lentisphaeria bacterium]|nr:carbohydrate-binding family 9-like protein [Lentisphaeria bacterium]